MTKILFVCLGNICRSPMAEFMFKDMIHKMGLDHKYYIESRATSYEETGNPVYEPARKKLKSVGISCEGKTAKRLEYDDYQNYDLIIGMEKSNIISINKIIRDDYLHKVFRLLDFTDNPRDISDPWYTRNFDKCYDDILEGLNGLLKYLGEK